MKIFRNLLTSFLLTIFSVVKGSELFGEGHEVLTGIFDDFAGTLTIDSIRNFIPKNKNRVLVYGMLHKPSIEVIEYALYSGMAEVNAFDVYGCCALSYALNKKDFEAAEALIRLGANVNSFSFYTILGTVARAGNLEGVEFLLRHGADVNLIGTSGVTVLSAAAETGNLQLVKLLVELIGDVNQVSRNNFTPLMVAAESRSQNIAVIEYLFEKGARITDVDSRGDNALFYAIHHRNFNSFAALLRHGGLALIHNTNAEHETIFDILWNERDKKLVEIIIENFN